MQMKKVCFSWSDPVKQAGILVYSYLHTSCWRLCPHRKTLLGYKWWLILEEPSPTAGCLIIHLPRREFPSQRQWCLANQHRRNPTVSNLKDLRGQREDLTFLFGKQAGNIFVPQVKFPLTLMTAISLSREYPL